MEVTVLRLDLANVEAEHSKKARKKDFMVIFVSRICKPRKVDLVDK